MDPWQKQHQSTAMDDMLRMDIDMNTYSLEVAVADDEGDETANLAEELKFRHFPAAPLC